MSIIISKQGQPAQKLDRAEFEKEDYLQNYIHENPESIPVYEIEESKKLLVVAREFSTESGPIDALAIDKDGDIYVVETKLYSNSDKRTVVAQALDYGASLWKHLNDFAEFTRLIDSEIQAKFHLTLEEKVKQFFGIEQDEVRSMLDRMNSNLKDGNIKFVILMDSIDERLKDLIIYVNQNSRFDIYAVQLEYYKFQDYEIMIPKMFGVEVKKIIRSGASNRISWTRDDFFKDAREKTDDKTFKLLEEFFEFSLRITDRVSFGSGSSGVASFKLNLEKGEVTPYRIDSKGVLIFGLNYMLYQKDKVPQEKVYRFIKELEEVKGIDVRDGVNFKRSELYLDLKNTDSSEIQKVKVRVEAFIKEVKK